MPMITTKELTTLKIAKCYHHIFKSRLAIVDYATDHGIKGAARRFGLDRKTVRAWRRRWQADGDQMFNPQNSRRGCLILQGSCLPKRFFQQRIVGWEKLNRHVLDQHALGVFVIPPCAERTIERAQCQEAALGLGKQHDNIESNVKAGST
jgi:transposase-like protein